MRTVVVVLAVALFASASLAQPARDDRLLAVVPLDGLGVDAARLAALDKALRAQVQALGLPMVEHDVVKAAWDAGPCEDVACLAKLGQAVGAKRVLAGSVGFADDEANIALKIIEVAAGTAGTPVEAKAPTAQAEARVKETAVRLLDPEAYDKIGRLVVEVTLPGAEVVVQGLPRGATPLFGPVEVRPGRQEVEVRYAGLKSWKGFVDVVFDVPYRLSLAEKDGALVEVPVDDTHRVGPGPGTPAKGGELPVLTMVGVGVGLVGVAAGVGAGISYAIAEDTFNDVRANRDASLIDDNQTSAAAYGVLLPVAVAGVAVGLGLIVFDLVE